MSLLNKMKSIFMVSSESGELSTQCIEDLMVGASKDPSLEPSFWKRLLESQILTYITGQALATEVAKTFKDGDEPLVFLHAQDKDGHPIFLLFTSKDEINKDAKASTACATIEASVLFKMISDFPGASAILNQSGKVARFIDNYEIKSLAQGQVPIAPALRAKPFSGQLKLNLGISDLIPDELKDLLCNDAKQDDNILKISLMLAVTENFQHSYLALYDLKNEDNFQKIFQRIGIKLREANLQLPFALDSGLIKQFPIHKDSYIYELPGSTPSRGRQSDFDIY